MWTIKVMRLVAVATLLAVCQGARMTQQSPKLTTTLMPMALSSAMAGQSPVPLTIIQEQPTPPSPPVCPQATDVDSPLGRLRSAMRNSAYTQMNAFFDAFIVFYSDEHLSEEPLAPERRLEYISGWDGMGTGAVLADGGAAVWVPTGDVGRARSTLSCAWLVLDADDPSHPTVPEWITERLARSGRVGGDARLTSVGDWQALTTALQREGLQLVHIPTLVDQLWNEEPDPNRLRPDFPKTVAKNYEMEFAGAGWRDKVSQVRVELRAAGADAMVVTALDEVAWLLNVRGRDLPYARLLKAFVIVSLREVRVFVPPGKLSVKVRDELAVYNCNNNCTRVNEYTTIYTELRRIAESKILIPAAGTFQRGASAAIAQSVNVAKRIFLLSPIVYLKAQKNPAEVKAMRKAHIRDAVAMCTLLSYLETKLGLSELSVETTVDITRDTQAAYVAPSMRTRAAFGANGAEPDYRATNVTNKRVLKNSTLVIQSGGQYNEGSTVVIRTVHYGIPSREERRAYTTVLRAVGALGVLRAPAALPAAQTDPIARAPLWAAGRDYPHPTGHGVGAALNRKEDPVVIDYRQDTNLHPLKDGYFITVEPGWYEPDRFGVRLGNVLEVMKAKSSGYLEFREATLLPYEPKLIDKSLLTEYEIKWLNAYNERIRKEVGPELQSRGLTDVFYWMMNKTLPFELPSKAKKYHSSAAVADNGMIINIIISVIIIHPLL